MSINRQSTSRFARRGFTIIELIVFIVVVAVALVGVLSVLNLTAQHNADPIITKQMQAIAETYLEEVSSMPFTYCDPVDANVYTATSTGGCATAAYAENIAAMGPKTVNGNLEARNSTVAPFNNVMDYGPSYPSSGQLKATTINGTSYVSYNSNPYYVTVNVISEALGPSILPAPAAATLRIQVVVTNGNNSLTLEGYRTRYAPNAVP
ncbi:MAG: prepilin-type N-terminal cleavage/methylation domain-containing protein [Burkholderiaceae bacterium]|nr:prepilin-type N-terminal cleavage/methylation domain-containing protein [Burkholderiaceae bacterium]